MSANRTRTEQRIRRAAYTYFLVIESAVVIILLAGAVKQDFILLGHWLFLYWVTPVFLLAPLMEPLISSSLSETNWGSLSEWFTYLVVDTLAVLLGAAMVWCLMTIVFLPRLLRERRQR